MPDEVDPIFPRRWVPPFLRNQFAQEEVVHTRVWVCGFYNDKQLDGGEFRYHAEREGKDYTVKFSGGTVYLYEGE
jgi:hypothetical protein